VAEVSTPRAPITLGEVVKLPKFGTDGMVPTSRRKRYNYKRQCKNCKLYVQERHRAQHTSECVGSGAWVEGFGGALKVHTKKIRRVAAQPRVPTHARNGKRACRFRKHVSRRQPKTAPKDTTDNDARRLVRAIQGGHKGAVGKPPKELVNKAKDGVVFSQVSLSMPKALSLPECELIIREVCSSKHVCTLILLGTCLASSSSEKAALACIAEHLADSSLIHLNIGEYNAPGCEFKDVLHALQHPSCIVGYMFAECACLPAGMKIQMREALRKNRDKLSHKLQFARHFAVARLGAHTWFMPSKSTLSRMRRISNNIERMRID